jgi:hypothetical protein
VAPGAVEEGRVQLGPSRAVDLVGRHLRRSRGPLPPRGRPAPFPRYSHRHAAQAAHTPFLGTSMGHGRARSGTSRALAMSHERPSGGHSAHRLWAGLDGTARNRSIQECPKNGACDDAGLHRIAVVETRRLVSDCAPSNTPLYARQLVRFLRPWPDFDVAFIKPPSCHVRDPSVGTRARSWECRQQTPYGG